MSYPPRVISNICGILLLGAALLQLVLMIKMTIQLIRWAIALLSVLVAGPLWAEKVVASRQVLIARPVTLADNQVVAQVIRIEFPVDIELQGIFTKDQVSLYTDRKDQNQRSRWCAGLLSERGVLGDWRAYGRGEHCRWPRHATDFRNASQPVEI